MKVAIVGCGLMGRKRAMSLEGSGPAVLCDQDLARAEALALEFPGSKVVADWREAVALPEIGIVMVCTPHDQLAPIGLAALAAGKHVLIEKPGARNRAELLPLAELAKKKSLVAKVGFNHRFHPAFRQAREILASENFGPLMFIRARYGHGGRPGYEKEWRAQPAISGGGELIDQGMHLIDLSRMFMGDISAFSGHIPTYFWDMPAEDNAFVMLSTPKGQTAWLHASWTEWKNLFSFEIYTQRAKLQIDGLGGSYGVETLTVYRMRPEMGPPDVEELRYPGIDHSWNLEYKDLLRAIENKARPNGDIQDCLAALEISDGIYAQKGKP